MIIITGNLIRDQTYFISKQVQLNLGPVFGEVARFIFLNRCSMFKFEYYVWQITKIVQTWTNVTDMVFKVKIKAESTKTISN